MICERKFKPTKSFAMILTLGSLAYFSDRSFYRNSNALPKLTMEVVAKIILSLIISELKKNQLEAQIFIFVSVHYLKH